MTFAKCRRSCGWLAQPRTTGLPRNRPESPAGGCAVFCFERCNGYTRCFHPLCRDCRDQLRDGRCPMCRIPLAGWLVPGTHVQLPTANAGDDAHGRGDDPGAGEYFTWLGPPPMIRPADEPSGDALPPAAASSTDTVPQWADPPLVLSENDRALSRQNRRSFNLWLPSGWAVFQTNAGCRYYVHEQLGTQWEAPAGTRPRR